MTGPWCLFGVLTALDPPEDFGEPIVKGLLIGTRSGLDQHSIQPLVSVARVELCPLDGGGPPEAHGV